MSLNASRTLFPGAMGPDGFISCFAHLMPEEQIRRCLILKGGPGVGKSTFMRRIHASLCAGGEASSLYVCSGDPDSLDAVAVPHAGLVVLDGTAPHIVDPRIPGARDSIINLGQCLNEEAMRPRLSPIRVCMDDHAACTRRARSEMRAAAAIRAECAETIRACIDERRQARMTSALIASVLDAPQQAAQPRAVRPVITDALTPKGVLCLIGESAYGRVIRLAVRDLMDAGDVLRRVSAAVSAAGYAVEEHLSPFLPGSLLHLGIPALDTLITTSDLIPAEQTFDLCACLPHAALLRRECALEQGAASVRTHTQRAVTALQQAGQLHDELETFYVPNMDFARWQQILDETLSSLA